LPRPKRQGIQNDAFKDPLSDYASPTYPDNLQRVLNEEPITRLKITPFTCVDVEQKVSKVMQMMDELQIACVMVTRKDRLVGIFSERDVLEKTSHQFDEFQDKPIRSVMTRKPTFIYTTDTLVKALALMAVGGFRHVPILDADGKVAGIIGPRRVNTYLRACLNEK